MRGNRLAEDIRSVGLHNAAIRCSDREVKLRKILEDIASCESHVVGDVVDIARRGLADDPQ